MENQHPNLTELHWLMDMLQNIDVGLVVLDADFNIQIWNGFMENHSGLLPSEAKGKLLFDLFPEISRPWFERKAQAVHLVKNKAFTIWEQRPYLFRFKNYRPITGTADFMYQNTTLLPLQAVGGDTDYLCIIVYDVTAIAINKQELQQANSQLAKQSQTDGLTHLYNRAFWEECLHKEFKRWQRSEHISSLVMIDIDYFKKGNDSYGHLVGDEVIKHLATTIAETARETDIAGRYGGEEFTVLLPDTCAKDAQVFAQRLRRDIENTIVEVHDEKLQYTISIGISEVHASMENHEAWLECADHALYQSKRNGRNQVTCHSLAP
jgi:diguanylate cyclase (GGDEF)-like protein